MTTAHRIIIRQASLVLIAAALIPLLVALVGRVTGSGLDQELSNPTALVSKQWFAEWALRFASMLTGGLAVVLPSWAYVALTKGEHRGERLLLLAWVKIVGTVALLAIGMILAPMPQWLLGGLALAYASHAMAAYWRVERQQ